jgi:molybdate transport system regulatory protein
MTDSAPRLAIRIYFDAGHLGPGKIELLEHIGRERSIAAAARAMQMSYKRAWELVDTMNHMFNEPVVITQPGRNTAGSTDVTPFGRRVVALYRAVERRAGTATDTALAELSSAARSTSRLTQRRSPPRSAKKSA